MNPLLQPDKTYSAHHKVQNWLASNRLPPTLLDTFLQTYVSITPNQETTSLETFLHSLTTEQLNVIQQSLRPLERKRLNRLLSISSAQELPLKAVEFVPLSKVEVSVTEKTSPHMESDDEFSEFLIDAESLSTSDFIELDVEKSNSISTALSKHEYNNALYVH